ncbi:hypothetical protein LCALC10_2810 [Lacticaseibacillus paracasei]|nr:hypothetical protein LCALC10_2810 [Lacticaseibacillus paracasei]
MDDSQSLVFLEAVLMETRWLCQCQCGNKCIVDSQRLQKGFTRSCGCLRSEISRSNIKTNNQTKKYMGNPKNFQLINLHKIPFPLFNVLMVTRLSCEQVTEA